METEKKTCCVFGHRKIAEKDGIKEKLAEIFENLIVYQNVDTFLVGSRSEFEISTRLQYLWKRYPTPVWEAFCLPSNNSNIFRALVAGGY